MSRPNTDPVVLTLDAGGTNFKFSAVQNNQIIVDPIVLASHGDDLALCLESIISGFTSIQEKINTPATAISFAFPGPANYPKGIIGDLGNLPGFRGGVPLGPILKEKFGIPVFINNDGDLFTYGEALSGLLCEINSELKKKSAEREYENLFGVTLGTGFGGGFCSQRKMLHGDTLCAAEIWCFRNKLYPNWTAEESISIRGIRRVFARESQIEFSDSPDPKTIAAMARGEVTGNQKAALRAFEELGIVLGDVLAQVLTLMDGPVVVGGGLAQSWSLFAPAMFKEIRSTFENLKGEKFSRLTQKVFDWENATERELFLNEKSPALTIGTTRLGNNNAVAIGAYNFALEKLKSRKDF